MLDPVEKILQKEVLHKDEIITLIQLKPPYNSLLHQKASDVKEKSVGKVVYFRGLIEYSNRCSKSCYYCGIRSHNTLLKRYQLTDKEVIEAANYAHQNRFASIVIQSGEESSQKFITTIERLLGEIRQLTNGELHVTLSLGEQKEEAYRRWFDAGAQRYLLRIETSNPELYKRLHPVDKMHTYNRRLETLSLIKKVGYQTGTGVMIGLPFQTVEDLADDLIFFREMDIDMAGMGPYIEHEETPLFEYRNQLLPIQERLEISLNMVALLRIMMPNINIAATTAMQTIDPQGRERALLAGANVMMPNLTPLKYKESYLLYNNKPGLEDDAEESKESMEEEIRRAGDKIGYGEWGNSRHYELRIK
ncbi:MAG: [FeFe] hydrogenase H-cluster radical SAM maturase HydE [Bacteroidales bacterium]|nr:[FeFe] hydrogenase H-cluster radical SAM maturase HydE [Bacteroidales bacterium]